jgi:hypothetical protein
MNSEDTTTYESYSKDKEELPTLPAETSDESDDGSTKSTTEKKVVVVKPTGTDVKRPDVSGSPEEVKKEEDDDKE